MEDFYPFRSEDIPELNLLAQRSLAEKDRWGKERKENAISFLLPLVIELLDNVEGIKSLNKTVLEEFDKNNAKVSDGFWKIVEAHLEENNGTGNLLRITEGLGTYGHWWIKRDLEKFLFRYSLPASSEMNENVNVYSLSRDLPHEKKDAGDPVPNSVEQALQNSVILEEIFKKLRLWDQKSFRLVSPTWMEETFSFWRRNTRILINTAPDDEMRSHARLGSISMLSFLALWENRKVLEANARGNEKQKSGAIVDTANYKLQEHPFHSYYVWYTHGMDIFSGSEAEDKFWQVCGPHIEDLKTVNASFTAKVCEKLLCICPNLKRLDISHQVRISEDVNSAGSSEERKRIINYLNRNAEINQTKPLKIAENLHTLILGDIEEAFFASLLFICPNLKVLNLTANIGIAGIGALLSPTLKGEFIKLKKLVWKPSRVDDFLSLRQYTEMLAKNKFDSLEHFELSTDLSKARAPPFNLYAALAQANKNLKTLKLELYANNPVNFMDLSPFTFPNLTKFHLVISANSDMKFDFGTLKGMPILERLEIVAKSKNKPLRKAGAQDWVFEGDRSRYLPAGVIVDYQYSAEDPILCSKLKEFRFVGWSLTKEDIGLLSGWFPNLIYLEAEVNHEALPVLVEKWQWLEKLVIRTNELISLRKLRPLKEKKNHLRIFQIISSKTWVGDKLLELKEHNGRLFFHEC